MLQDPGVAPGVVPALSPAAMQRAVRLEAEVHLADIAVQRVGANLDLHLYGEADLLQHGDELSVRLGHRRRLRLPAPGLRHQLSSRIRRAN